MALAPCRECQREISTEATACPHCGVPRPAVRDAKASRRWMLWTIVLGIIGLSIVGVVRSGPTLRSGGTPSGAPVAPLAPAHLRITIRAAEAHGRYATFEGVVENMGKEPATGPAITFQVRNRDGTPIGEGRALLVGEAARQLNPGQRSGFSALVTTTEDAAGGQPDVTASHPYSVVWPKSR
jgi:RNA polymerase subunit RPABC4/transcription elongation factor Spt4